MSKLVFIVALTFRNIFKSKWINLILIIQIAILITLAFFSQSLMLSFRQFEEQLNDYRQEIYFMIGHHPTSGRSFQDFTEADYRELALRNEEKLRRGEMYLAVVERPDFFLPFKTSSQDLLFTEYFGFVYSGELYPMLAKPLISPHVDSIYAPEGFLTDLRISLETNRDLSENRGFYIHSVDVENSRLLGDSGWVSVRPITELYPVDSSVRFNPWLSLQGEGIDFPISKLVLVPSQTGIYRRPDREEKAAAHLAVWMPVQNQKSANAMHNILEFLNAKYPDCKFLPMSYRDVISNERQNVVSLTFMLNLMSIILGIIVGLGFLGHWLLLIEKRARSITTSIVLGASKTYLFTSNFIEMASVLLSGVLLGGYSCSIIAETHVGTFPLQLDLGFLMLVVAFCLIFSAVMSAISTVYFCGQSSTKLLESRKVEL